MNFWGDGIWHKVRLTIPVEIFTAMNKSSITFAELMQSLEEWEEWRNKTLQTNIGSGTQFLSCGNNLFAFSVYKDEFCVWDESGNTSVLHCGIDSSNVPSKDFIDQLHETLNNYNNGICRCSDCGIGMTKDDVAGRYFAGIYCKNCWDKEWKAIEAAETYA